MKILLIPDSFKDSITSAQIIDLLKVRLTEIDPGIEVHSIVASDGGEGFLESVAKFRDTKPIYHDTLDPIGRTCEAYYLIEKENKTAYIELAQASGYERLDTSERNPMYTSTSGTGLQILHAINRGVKRIFVGLGGSATNDGGIGMASVLGYTFYDDGNNPILPIGKNLGLISSIKGQFSYPEVEVFAINDVQNPLHGPKGAAFTYGPQKGASADEVRELNSGLINLDSLVKQEMNMDHANTPGSGAAGGSAYGLKVFCGAKFISGIDFLFEMSSFDQLVENHDFDLIITGEGCIDEQSLKGKLVHGVIQRASGSRAKIIGICGKLKLDQSTLMDYGLDAAFEIAPSGTSVEESIEKASYFVRNITPDIIRL